MKINSTSNTNFKGIYRIANTPKNISDINKFVTPMYTAIKKEPFFSFYGKNPFRMGIDFMMEIISKRKGASVDWLKMNAQIHGIDSQVFDCKSLYVVSGEKSVRDLTEYVIKRMEHNLKEPSFIDKVKTYFSDAPKNEFLDKPEHLRPIFRALEADKIEDEEFLRQYGSQIVDVKTPQELVTKMMCER